MTVQPPAVKPAPLAMGRVALTVHDLDGVAGFYEQAVGLRRLLTDPGRVALGVGEVTLVELRRDPAARRRSPREAGLFHTAFLLPSRADLGAWTRHAAATRIPVVGASDHGVSEALYLADPEGNGVEIYADRPTAEWRWKDGLVEMRTEALDVSGLIDHTGKREWRGFPAGSVVGHVHLQVGAIAPAEAFYAGILGLGVTCRYAGATFYAADGYHHHLATNIWNSRGAPVRDEPATGLANVEIRADGSVLAAAAGRQLGLARSDDDARSRLSLRDPWGTSITLVAHQSQSKSDWHLMPGASDC